MRRNVLQVRTQLASPNTSNAPLQASSSALLSAIVAGESHTLAQKQEVPLGFIDALRYINAVKVSMVSYS